MAKNRQAKARPSKLPAKVPKAEPAAESSQQQTPLFCFRYADRACANTWGFTPDSVTAADLLAFLGNIGRNTWAEIERMETGGKERHRKHHSQAITSIGPAAQKDMERLRLDETFGEEMFRFRISGEQRLWGFRAGRTFHVVWWDPNHGVYPTEKN